MSTSGEKLAIWTRNTLPEAKIMLIMSENKSRIKEIIKTIPHDGFLIKKDIISVVVLNAVEAVLDNSSFYSETIEKLMEKVEFQEICLDELNKKILYCLSNGI